MYSIRKETPQIYILVQNSCNTLLLIISIAGLHYFCWKKLNPVYCRMNMIYLPFTLSWWAGLWLVKVSADGVWWCCCPGNGMFHYKTQTQCRLPHLCLHGTLWPSLPEGAYTHSVRIQRSLQRVFRKAVCRSQQRKERRHTPQPHVPQNLICAKII